MLGTLRGEALCTVERMLPPYILAAKPCRFRRTEILKATGECRETLTVCKPS